MQAVLSQINSVPGIVGCMLCDEDGRPAAQLFPPLFDASMMTEAATALSDSAQGLEGAAGTLDLLELRYHDARIVVKSMAASFLVILCTKTVNMQLLTISLNVAVKKLDKLFAAHITQGGAPVAMPAVPESRPHQGHPPAVSIVSTLPGGAVAIAGSREHVRGVTLSAQVMKKSAGNYWENMHDMVSINRWTAVQVSDFFNTGNFKKIKLTNPENGLNCKLPVHIIKDDTEHFFDGKAILSQAGMERLNIKQGGSVVATIDIGGGIFGWEGI